MFNYLCTVFMITGLLSFPIMAYASKHDYFELEENAYRIGILSFLIALSCVILGA